MGGYPCCCNSEDVFHPCAGAFNRADYELHLTLSGGNFTAGCHTCDKLLTTFILNWDGSRYRYTNSAFGNACSGTRRRLDIGLTIGVACTTGVAALSGRARDSNNLTFPPSGSWVAWGQNENAGICLVLGLFSPISWPFPQPGIQLGLPYSIGNLDSSNIDPGFCDCHNNPLNGDGAGPEATVAVVRV
jgi:hypothetical protein